MVEERGRIKPIPFFIHHKTHRPTQGFLKTQIMKTTSEELLKKKLDELSQHSHYQPYKYLESILKETILEAMEEFASLKEDKKSIDEFMDDYFTTPESLDELAKKITINNNTIYLTISGNLVKLPHP